MPPGGHVWLSEAKPTGWRAYFLSATVASWRKVPEICQFCDGLRQAQNQTQGRTPVDGTQVRTTAEADPKFHHAAETTVSVGIQWCQQEQFSQDGRCAKQNNCRRCRNMLPSEGSGCLRQSSRKGNIPKLYCFRKSKVKSLLKDGRWNKNMHAADTDSAADCKTGIASLEIFILRKMDRNIIWLTPWVVGRDWRWSWIWDHHTAAVILLWKY